jgi:hypothetical protein
MRPTRRAAACLAAIGLLLPVAGLAQERLAVRGTVIDTDTRVGIEGVALVVAGTDVSAVTDANGVFVLRGMTQGRWTLTARRLGYGERSYDFVLADDADISIEIRMSQEAVQLDPVVVETITQQQRADLARGTSRNVVDRPQIEAALGISRNLGDLIRQTVPGIRLRQSNNVAGSDVCLEFRGAAEISLMERGNCNHPLLIIDGAPVSNPNFVYGTIGLNNIQKIEVIPPGEAGARYGSGSLYGVLVIDTRDPRPDRPTTAAELMMRQNRTFDWSQEPRGHNGFKTAGAALVGSTLGLAGGLAVGRQCFAVDQRDQIVATCSGAGNVASAIAAFAIPALTTALGARLGGETDGSVGRLGPAMVGATMALLPGYVYSLSTVGRGSRAANIGGAVLLLVGTPLTVTVADRLFRKRR